MSEAVFEFPLKEKVRNYLRVEQLLGQLKSSASSESPQLQTVFFEQLFELLDLIERLDLRSDMSKDLDAHEKNLVYWSQHPKIDSAALEQALKTIVTLKQKLKTERRFKVTMVVRLKKISFSMLFDNGLLFLAAPVASIYPICIFGCNNRLLNAKQKLMAGCKP